MNSEEIRREIFSILSLSLEGQEIENPKVDCKRQWYNLTNEEDRNKFLKDASSIANTVGLDGFIIIGYDEKNRAFYDATFSDCGLRDTADLNGIISRHVERFFEISSFDINYNGHKLSILHIPPSFDKPHVLPCYVIFKNGVKREEKHRIFVRKGTSSDYANKYDIEFMYYDRKNLIPEYEIISSINLDRMHLAPVKSGDYTLGMNLSLDITFENLGRRPVAVILLDLDFSFDPPNLLSNYKFTSGIIPAIIVNPNEMVNNTIKLWVRDFERRIFNNDESKVFLTFKREFQTKYISLRLTSNRIIRSEISRYI